jgi:hypothetical protein
LILDTDGLASDHICPPEFRPNDELFRKAFAVCGPVMRTCIDCWNAKSTERAMDSIREATGNLSLNKAQRISNEYGFTNVSSKISLVVPGNGHKRMDFAKLSEYAERRLMNQIYKKSWAATRQILVTLDKVPDARSFAGRIFEYAAQSHVLFSDPETELEPLYGAPSRKLGDLRPLHDGALSDAMKKRPGGEGKQKWLVAGYYATTAKNDATINAMAIVKDSDSKGDFQRVILFKYTKPVGLLKVRANFKKLGLEDLIPFEKSDSADRHHWVLIWVVTKRAAANFKVKRLSVTDNAQWVDKCVDEYKLVIDLKELKKKKPSRLYFHSMYPR